MDILNLSYSGRLSFGRRKKFKPDGTTPHVPTEHEEYVGNLLSAHGIKETQRLFRTLGLSSVSNLQKAPKPLPRRSRGSNGISSQSRRRVIDGATLLQERYSRNRLTFLTLTLPPAALLPSVVQSWTSIVKKLRQWLVYRLEKSQLPPHVLGVTEIQEQRQASAGGVPCLHLHIIFVGKRIGGDWVVKPEDIDGYWSKLLSEYAGEHIEVTSACCLERIKKDASGYLGKYLSKGCKALRELDVNCLPPSWHLITRGLLHQIKALAIRCEGELAEYLWDYYQENRDLFRFHRFVQVNHEALGKITLGWYGDLKNRDTYRKISSEIRALTGRVKGINALQCLHWFVYLIDLQQYVTLLSFEHLCLDAILKPISA